MKILLSLLIAQFVMALAFSMSLPLLSFVAVELNASTALTAWILGSNAIIFVFLTYFLGVLSDRLGRREVIITSWFVASVSFIVLGPLPTLFGVMLSRLLGGAHGAASAVVMAYVSDLTDADSQRTATMMGYIGSAVSLGWIIGPALMVYFPITDVDSAINLLTKMGYVAMLAWGWLTFALYTSEVPKANKSDRSGDLEEVTRMSIAEYMKLASNGASQLLLVVAVLSFLCYSATNTSMIAILQTRHGLDLAQISRVYVFASMVAFISEVWLIRFLSSVNRASRLCYALLLVIPALLILQIAMPQAAKLLLPLYFITLSFSISVIYPVTMSWFSVMAAKKQRGAIAGIVGSIITASQISGPILVGLGETLSSSGYLVVQLIVVALAVATLACVSVKSEGKDFD